MNKGKVFKEKSVLSRDTKKGMKQVAGIQRSALLCICSSLWCVVRQPSEGSHYSSGMGQVQNGHIELFLYFTYT